MAVLSDVVTDLDADDNLGSYESIAKMALLSACCGHLETATELLRNSACENTGNILTAELARAILSMSHGQFCPLSPSPNTLTLRAFIAASWFVKMDQSALETLVNIIAKDPVGSPAIFIPKLVNALKAEAYVNAADLCIDILIACDRQYVSEHPDVNSAIRSGYFVCGTEHYIKHGRTENRRWPVADALFSLFPSTPDPKTFFYAAYNKRQRTSL